MSQRDEWAVRVRFTRLDGQPDDFITCYPTEEDARFHVRFYGHPSATVVRRDRAMWVEA